MAFKFSSDSTVTDVGPFVDEINLWCYTVSNPALVNLKIDPPGASVGLDQEFEMAVQMMSGAQLIDGVAAYLNFDPIYLEVVSIVPDTALPAVTTISFDNTSGMVNFSAMTSSNFPSGTFTVATIRFKARAITPSTYLNFNMTSPRLSDVTYGGASVLESCSGAESM